MRTSRRRLLLLLAALTAGCASTADVSGPPPTFYPAPPARARLQLLGTYSSAEDIEEESAFRDFVVGEEVDRRIVRAHGVAWHDGKLYVCDPGRPHVMIFDLETRELRMLDPARPDMFKMPIEIAIAPDGWKYITDTVHRQVLAYDDDDTFRGAFGGPEIWKPVGIAATADRLFVTDLANHNLAVLDRHTGKELRRIGKEGSEPGDFYFPMSISIAADGDLYVTDSFNFRVQRLRPDGTPVSAFGRAGQTPGSFSRPRGIAVDPDGRVYAVDAAFENVQLFDEKGRLLLFFGGPGPAPGSLNLPASVKVSREAVSAFEDRVAPGHEIDYVLFVSSQLGPQMVTVYGLLKEQ